MDWKNHLEKNPIQKIEKTVKLSEIAACEQKITTDKANFCSNTIFSLYFKIRKEFTFCHIYCKNYLTFTKLRSFEIPIKKLNKTLDKNRWNIFKILKKSKKLQISSKLIEIITTILYALITSPIF